MPFSNVKDMEKSFPSVKSLTPAQKKKCLEIFNAMMKDEPDMDEGMAIATAMKKAKEMKMDEDVEGTYRYLSTIELGDSPTSEVEVLRVGTIQDRGLKITKAMLEEFVQHFKDNVYGTEIQVNLEHMRGSEAAGWVKDLYLDGTKMYAQVEWTEMGQEKISKKLFKFVSAELASSYPHHKTGEMCNNVFIGLALTNCPALKSQKPLALSETVINLLSRSMFAKLLAELKKRSIVSKEDKALMKSMLEELPPEQQEEHKEGVAEVEAKPEEVEKTEEEKAAEAEAAKPPEGGEALADKTKVVSLAEFTAVKSKLDAMELKEYMTTNLILSESVKTGFVSGDETEAKLKKFLIGLSEEQRAEFKSLVAQVRTVDLSIHGSTSVGSKEDVALEDQIVALADKLLTDGKAKNIAEAQKMATDELSKK